MELSSYAGLDGFSSTAVFREEFVSTSDALTNVSPTASPTCQQMPFRREGSKNRERDPARKLEKHAIELLSDSELITLEPYNPDEQGA
jgi:hypothetical protein